MRGRSLVPLLRGEAAAGDAIAFGEAGYSRGGDWIRVAVDGRFSLHRLVDRSDRKRVAGDENAEFALFDLVRDRGETRNVATEHPEDFARLRAALEAWEALHALPMDRDREGFAPGERVEVYLYD